MSKNNLIGILSLCTALTAVAAEGVFWGAPELESVKWESRQVTAGDFTGDGRTDLAVINGVERSIDVFAQMEGLKVVSRPNGKLSTPLNVLTRFEKTRIPLGSASSSFVFGDWDGSGKLGLAYASTREGIVFMQKAADGRWSVVGRLGDIKPTAFTHALWFGKLYEAPVLPAMPVTAPEKTEVAETSAAPTLVVLAEGQVVLIRDRAEVARYGCLRKDAAFLNLTDINGDGLLDIAYEYPAPVGVAYRLQTTDHRFDAERILPYDFDNEKIFAFDGPNFYFFGGKSATVERSVLVEDPLSMERVVYANASDISDAVWVDMSGKGAPDLVSVDGRGGQLCVFGREGEGFVGHGDFPTLKGVSSIVGLADGAVALYSPEEKSIGVASYDRAAGRLLFPKLLDMPGEPVALVGVPARAWAIGRDDKDYFACAIVGGDLSRTRLKLEGLKRAPDGFEAYGDPKGSVLLVAYQGRDLAQMYVLSDTAAVPVKITAALARSNFTGLDSARVGWADVNGDGKGELLVAGRTSVRIFSLADGKIELADQTLPVDGDVSLRLPFVCNGALWAYDGRSKRWDTFARNDKGLYAAGAFYDGLPFDPQKILIDGKRFVAIGQKAFGVYSPGVAGKTFKTQQRFESAVDMEGYNVGSLESLGGTTKTAILYGQDKRILELVNMTEPAKSVGNFTLYEADPHYGGRRGEDVEPREYISVDVTGDGRPDLVMLMHDKLAVYPRVVPAAAKTVK